MKVKIQKTKNRFSSILGAVSVFVVVCSLVFSFVGPVTAYAEWGEPLNYQDLDYKVKLGSEFNTVTVPLPSDNYYFSWLDDSGLRDDQYGSTTFVIPGTIGDSHRIRVYPASTFGVALDNIPEGSKLKFDVKLTEYASDDNGLVDYELPSVKLIGHYLVKQSGKWVWKDTEVVGTITESSLAGKYTCEFVIQSNSYNAVGFVPLIQFDNFIPLTDSYFKIEIVSAVLDMQISSDYWQQWQNEQNGEMLNALNDKLDGAINGTPEQNQQAQEAVGALNDSTDKLGELGDTLSSVDKPTINSSQISAGSLVPETSLVVLSAPFQALWENEILLAILTIVVTLVLVSWVFFGKKG